MLIVEDGTGLANAESYVAVADLQTYAANRGLPVGTDTTLMEQGLRRATAYVDTYRGRFSGYRTNRRAQALEWPRVGAYYYVPDNGRSSAFYLGQPVTDDMFYDQGYDYILSTFIPPEVINACCEAAVREIATPGTLQPDLERGGAIQSIRAGSVGVTYSANAPSGTTTQIIDSILGGLLMPGSGNGLFGRMARG